MYTFTIVGCIILLILNNPHLSTRHINLLNSSTIPLPPSQLSLPNPPITPPTLTLSPPISPPNHHSTLPDLPISLNAALINARSVRNKIPSIISLMTDYNLDILFITETWLSPLDSPHIAALNTPSYQFIHNPRNSPHPGGGTGILHTYTLTLSNISHHSFSHSEALSCAISSPFSRTFNTTLFYRPPSPSIDTFLDEFRLYPTHNIP